MVSLWYRTPERLRITVGDAADNYPILLKKNGGRGWDRTSDPYDVNVVLSR